MMDVTRGLVREVSQEVILADFKSGERNLIISTAVAEEGIDIQACGSVIRWDLPPNPASWAQSKGRARKRRSTFTMMFEEGSAMEEMEKWRGLEDRMRAMYNNPSRDVSIHSAGAVRGFLGVGGMCRSRKDQKGGTREYCEREVVVDDRGEVVLNSTYRLAAPSHVHFPARDLFGLSLAVLPKSCLIFHIVTQINSFSTLILVQYLILRNETT